MEKVENAYEAWSLYDTVMIGEGMKNYHPKWYNSFVELSSETSVPFFNQRNRSAVGVPYCSFDSAEQIPFAFHCYSMGLEWYAPCMQESYDDEVAGWRPSVNINPQLFMELLRHTSIRLQVSQDEKLLINGLGAPGGGGISGTTIANNVGFVLNQNHGSQNLSNGAPLLTNRWAFAEPIQIPRNRNIAAWVEISNYGKELLKNMAGPQRIAFNFTDSLSTPAAYMMRLSMFGKREVQQRNALHF